MAKTEMLLSELEEYPDWEDYLDFLPPFGEPLNLGPNGRIWWRTTTAKEVADLLADTVLVLEAEKGLGTQELNKRKSELADHFLSVRGESCLEEIAEVINEQRLLYRGSLWKSSRAEHRRRLREAIATIRQLLPIEIEEESREPGHICYAPGQMTDLRFAKEHRKLLDMVERFRLRPASRRTVPWHDPALALAAVFLAVICPEKSRWRDSPLICFLQQALRLIGVKGSLTRSAIVKMLVKAGQL
jgi:hypothetical protein